MAKINCRIDGELDRAINAYAAQNGLTRSQAVRELLRQIVGYPEPTDRGWREGFARGRGEALAAFHQASAAAQKNH